MQVYTQFYRQHGIRRASDLTNPPLSALTELVLPKDSVVHFLPYDDLSVGPEPEHPLFKQYPGRVLVEHITQLIDPIGSPRPNRSTPENALIKGYHRRFRSMRPLHDFDKSLRDARTLIAENYTPLNKLYMYMRSVYSTFYQWHNVLKTAVIQTSKRVKGNDRQHFILAEVPRRLPTIAMLKKSSGDYTSIPRKQLDVFSRPEYQFLLEFWKWLGNDRDSSLFSALDAEDYSRINILWLDRGSWLTMNLQSLLEAAPSVDAEEDEGSTQLQRRFLKMLIAIVEHRSPAPSSKEMDEEIKTTQQDQDERTQSTSEPIPVESEEEQIDRDIDQLDTVDEETIAREEDAEVLEDESLPDPKEEVLERATAMMEAGALSPAQHRRVGTMVEKSKTIANPYGKGTLEAFRQIDEKDMEITEKDIQLPSVAGVTDESMFQSTLKAFDTKYITDVLDKDIVNAALSIERAGVIVTDYSVEEVETASDHFRTVTMKINPIDGDSSTIRFRIPIVTDTGEFTAGGVKYRLRKQRSDKPIRKVKSNTVALTSYYAKVFVERSEKVVVNYPKWIHRELVSRGFDDDDKSVTDVKHIDTFVSTVKLPRIYTVLAKRFREFTVNGKYRIYIDWSRRIETFGEEVVKNAEVDGYVFAGMVGKDPIVVDDNNAFYLYKNGKHEVLGQIEDLIGLDQSNVPVEIAEFRLFSRNVPVVIALGHRLGLSKLMRLLGITPRRVVSGARMDLEKNEYPIRFSDETLIFNKENPKANLILAGLNRYHRSLRRYSVDSFDDPEVYANLMEENGMRIGFIRELELAMDMFVDPITEDLLKQMNEPTTLERLMIRACEMLLIDWHPDETDMAYMRVRGYERMAGAVYDEMVKSVRKFRSRGVGSTARVEMNPEAVWMAINTDSSVGQVEESNPVENLKEKELLTYIGKGGRTTQSMVKRTRQFHGSDMGVVSESSVDSSAVGVNAYLSANPQLKNLRGLAGEYESGKTGNSSMISTSALLAPGSDMDDPKRINFIGIQNKHIVAIDGGTVPPLRTGYEKVIAHRCDSLFATTANQDGELVEVTDEHCLIRYKDGSETHVELGTIYGNVVGTMVPHKVVCDLPVGKKLKEGDVVAFNTGFFQRDSLDPMQVLMKGGIMAKTAIMERSHTFEDASVISDRISKSLNTRLTKIRTIVVGFDQTIRNLVKPGTEVDVETILCTIENSVTADNDLFDEDSLDALKLMASNTPKAKITGQVEKIEVFYHGDEEDMSESVAEIVKTSDKRRKKRLKALGKTITSGQVDGTVRIDKDPLDLDTVAIRVYITGDVGAGIGDKGVFGNQMKSVFSNVMSGVNETEKGEALDALFGYISISNRIVLSPEVIGTTNTLLRVMSQNVAERYFSKKRGK